MTQKSVNIPDTFRNKDFWLRAVSVMLSLTLMVLCVPSYNSSTASGENQNGNPNVLTNSSVTFRDSKFKNVNSVESGEIFYLMATIAGNNVNQNDTDAYRIEINDPNLALLNFKNNGFTDGEYNGYKLTIDKNDSTKRYIDFKITNGETKVVRLQAKFLNGKTKAEEKTIKLIQTSTNKSVTGSVDVKATTDWKSSKTEDKSQIKKEDIEKGTVINYTLNASPVNPNAKKGALWINGLKFTDTLTLSDGLKFKNGAEDAIKGMLPSQYQKTVTISGNTAIITITVDSQNENAEMPSTTINIPFKLQDVVDIGEDFTGGTINNDLTVNGKRYGETDYTYEIGKNTVSAEVVTPAPPKPADFTISKTVDNKKDYYLNGETVTFKISATNIGEQPGNITLTDTIPEAYQGKLSFVEIKDATAIDKNNNEITIDNNINNNEITFTNVQPGATVSAKVTCTVNVDETKTLTNQVTAGKKSAYADINVKKKITISKDGYVGEKSDNKEYIIGEKNDVTYIITVKNNDNTGAETFSFTDNVPTYVDVKEVTISKENSGITHTGNEVKAEKCKIGAGEIITVTIKGTISDTATDTIVNTLTGTGEDKNPSVEFKGETRKVNLGIFKYAVDGNKYVAGQPKQFIIEVTNSGDLKAENVTVNEIPATEITIDGITWTSNNAKHTESNVTKTDNELKIAEILPGEKITFTVNTTISDTATGDITNKATLNYNGVPKESSTKITRDNSGDYKAEKWIVDENGETLVDANGNVKEGFEGFSVGDKITFRAKFTNNSTKTIEDLHVLDYCKLAHPENTEDKIEFKIIDRIDNKEEKTYPKDIYQIQPSYGVGGVDNNWKTTLDNINMNTGESITLEYSFYINESINDTNPNLNEWFLQNNIGFTDNEYVNTLNDGANLAKANVIIPRNFTFTTTKTFNGDSTIDIQSTLDNFKDTNYTYYIKINPNDKDTKDYTNSTFTITDELPDGMDFNSIDTTSGVDGDVTAKQDGKKLTFTFKPTLNGTKLSGVTIAYKTKLTPEKAEQIFNTASAKNPVSLTNTVTKINVDKFNKT